MLIQTTKQGNADQIALIGGGGILQKIEDIMYVSLPDIKLVFPYLHVLPVLGLATTSSV